MKTLRAYFVRATIHQVKVKGQTKDLLRRTKTFKDFPLTTPPEEAKAEIYKEFGEPGTRTRRIIGYKEERVGKGGVAVSHPIFEEGWAEPPSFAVFEHPLVTESVEKQELRAATEQALFSGKQLKDCQVDREVALAGTGKGVKLV